MTLMIGMNIYSEEEVIRALRSQLGSLDLTARELNVSRGQLYDYMSKHPEVLEAKIQIKEAFKDKAEHLLVTKMETDNQLLVFFLKTQAQDRGYNPTTTLKGDKNSPIQVNMNARALIAAMRMGFEEDEIDGEGEESDEGRDILAQSGIFSDGDGS